MASQGGCWSGGRSRRGSQAKRNSRVAKGKKVMRGGNFYSVVGGDSGLGTAGPRYDGVPNTGVDQSGNPVPDAVMRGVTGGRRRRTGKKGSRKGRRVTRRRRTMRGGAGYYSISGVGAGYAGQGAGGLADFGGYSTKGPVAGGPTQGGDGVMRSS